MSNCFVKDCTNYGNLIEWENQVVRICPDHLEYLRTITADVEKAHFFYNQKKKPEENLSKCSTGAVRSKDADNARYDLISPIAMRALAETYAEGAKKYSDYNWEKGFPVTDLLNHAVNHIYLFLEGDRSEPHLAHAMWNLGAAIHSHELWPELNKNLRGPGCKAPV